MPRDHQLQKNLANCTPNGGLNMFETMHWINSFLDWGPNRSQSLPGRRSAIFILSSTDFYDEPNDLAYLRLQDRWSDRCSH